MEKQYKTKVNTKKVCEVYDITDPGTVWKQESGWSTYNHWNVLTVGKLTYAPPNVTALLNKLRINVKQIAEWEVGVCAEMWCLLRALEMGVAPKNIRIKTATGASDWSSQLLTEPCQNCSQWLEKTGIVYKLQEPYIGETAVPKQVPEDNDNNFPPLGGN